MACTSRGPVPKAGSPAISVDKKGSISVQCCPTLDVPHQEAFACIGAPGGASRFGPKEKLTAHCGCALQKSQNEVGTIIDILPWL